MTTIAFAGIPEQMLPDHTQLPDSNGTFTRNELEHPQSILLTDSIWPVLHHRHPDGNFLIGQDLGIYWRLTHPPEPPERGSVTDWFYVPNVQRTLNGKTRRSYVLWQEWIAPLLALEFVSGDGSEERDQTPVTGKYWIYERAIRVPFYGIYEVNPGKVTVYHLVDGLYEPLPANGRGHYEIGPMGVELGIWEGEYLKMQLPWLRWWDLRGNLVPTSEERAKRLAARLETSEERAKRLAARLETSEERAKRLAARLETSEERAERLAAQLRSLGAEPEV